MYHHNSSSQQFARNLRKSSTNAENYLWLKLRNRQIYNTKFKRQHPIGPYVADFISLERKIVIELDGSQHGDKKIKDRDEIRTKWFEKNGYQVLRFWDNEIFMNMDGVLERIYSILKLEQTSP